MRTRRGFGVDSTRIRHGSDASDMDSTRIRRGQGRDGTDKVPRGCNIRQVLAGQLGRPNRRKVGDGWRGADAG
eukprot:6904566-Pyramimonas_sp.AAC.1